MSDTSLRAGQFRELAASFLKRLGRASPSAPRTDQVKDFFEKPGIYFKNDAHVAVRIAAARELLGDLKGVRLLDVGCGDGRISLQFLSESNSLTLLDLSTSMLELAAGRVPSGLERQVRFVNESIQDFATSEKYDVILCIGVLAHLPAIEVALQRIAELAAPGARCVLQVTDYDEPVGKLLDNMSRARRWVVDRRGYSVNRTRSSEVIEGAARFGLQFLRARQFWVLPPGVGRLPVRWGLRLLRAMYESPRVSALGAEKLLLFEKSIGDG